MRIGNIEIGLGEPPLVIAELSGNHNQSCERAIKLVEKAAATGVKAIKLQTYTADTMTLDHDGKDFLVSNSLWEGKTLYELYEQAHTPWEWHGSIFRRAHDLGLVCFSTPFDTSAVDFLESLDTPAYKIASFELNDIELIKKVAETNKPIIMSAGMATVSELDLAVSTAKKFGCNDIVVLKCTSSYPASPVDSNIVTLSDIRRKYGCEVGLSDHTMGIGVALTAVAFGAVLIEKHFTLSREDGGVDSQFSMEPEEMEQLVKESKRSWQSLGHIKYGATEAEKKSIQFRRSLYIVEDIKKGDILNMENVRSIRPGYGLPPKELPKIIGKRVKASATRGTALAWDIIE